MLIGKPPDIPSSEITLRAEYDRYMNRRRFLRTAASTAVAAMGVERLVEVFSPRVAAQAGTKLNTVKSPLTTTGEQLTSFEDITHYNNFYEFGVEKDQPRRTPGACPPAHGPCASTAR